MRLSLARSTSTSAEQAPWALVKTDRDARRRPCSTSRCAAVDSLKTLFTPFLPFTSQTRARAARLRRLARRPARVPRRSTEEDGATHEVLTGDYASWVGALGSRASSRPGQQLREPRPLFRKLDAGDRRRRARARADARDRHARAPRRARRGAGEVVARARAAGVDAHPHRRRPTSRAPREALALAERHDGVYARLGIHPHEANDATDADVAELRDAARAPEGGRASGETGLDYFRDYAPRDAQLRLFDAQLDARRRARQAGRDPHARRRRRHARARSPASTARSSCTASRRRSCSRRALERGWYVSFAGNVDLPEGGRPARSPRAQVPADRHPRRDRQPVPRAAARARQARTSRRTSCTRSPRSPQARGEDPARARARRSTRNAAACFGLP